MRVIAAGSAVVLVVIALFLVRPVPVVNLDSKVCDLLTAWAGPGKASGRVVVVEIDEASLAEFGGWPWPRDLLARITREILNRGAATVVFDMMFPQEDRRPPRSTGRMGEAPLGTNDEVFANALSDKPTVVGYTLRFDRDDAGSSPCSVQTLPLAMVGPRQSGEASYFRAAGALCSVPQISRAAAGNGFLNASPDTDGKMRRVPLVMEYANRYYPSLAFAALNVNHGVAAMELATDAHGASRLRLDSRAVPLEGPALLRLRFRGARRTFPYVSVSGVLGGRLPAEMLRGKIAIVGGSALGLEHEVVTPTDAMFPDVEVQATAIDNLLQGDAFHLPGDAHLWELALALLVGLTSTFLLAAVRSLWGALITLGMAAGVWTGCALALSATGTLFSPLPATAVLGCNLSVLTLLNYLQEKSRADRTEQQLVSTTEHSREVLEESESRYQRLVENVNDAIIMDDIEGRLVFANRRFREWFGFEDRNIRDVILEDYVAPEWRSELRDRHDRRMRGEAVPDHYEYEGVRPDGTRLWIEALVTNVEEDGRTTGTQAALRDITERKRIEAQYLQAQKMESVGRLAGGVAHDFNNLLTVINGYSELLLVRLGPEDPSRASVEQILEAGEQAAEMTQKLLAFSRKQLIQPRALDLNLVVAEAEKLFRRLIGEDIELITQLSPDLGQVMADPGHLHQILMNLVVNARDSMPQGGKIVIETKNVEVVGNSAARSPDLAAGSYVYLGVTDTGIGMSKEVKQHLFEPFFTTKAPGMGTGLGLATTFGIVQQSGGWIGASSEVGQGAAFHIYLPRIVPDLEERPRPGPPAAALRGSETVLVVEDQDAVRQLVCNILEGCGYRILEASSGPDAIRLAQGYPDAIHLLLADVVLPLMNGRVLAEEMRASRPGIKVLYVSGYTEDMIGRHGVLDSHQAYLQKPFTPEALAAKVRETLADGGIQGEATGS
jgi:PAS domain S-box-containing protein